jgi:DNA repair protein RecN (Recombination protein N)
MRMDEAEKARRVDALTYQIAELDRAALREGEEEELSARRTLLRNAGKLTGLVETASQALSGDDEDPGAVGRLGDAARAIRQASRLSEEFAGLGGSLENLCSLAETRRTGARLREGWNFPRTSSTRSKAADVLCRLKKKYGATVSDMLSYLEASRKELSRIESADESLAATEKRLAAALAEAKKRALCLSEARRDRAARLEESVARELSDLDMARVRFRAGFSGKDAPDGLDESGMDDVRFLLSANLGEEPKPLSKIASGGELARIMLALKNVMARSDDVGTLVFDEVDTGVSGRAAARVAEKLRQVARYRQVLCVTHLPQIAAAAATHFTVEKGERGGRTYTAVRPLSDAARIDEIARLLSGDRVTDAGRKNAAEMLRIARGVKES